MLCDYCPNTTFKGTVCPTCGYDYADVRDYYPPTEEELRESVRKMMEEG